MAIASAVVLYVASFGPYCTGMRNDNIGFDPDGDWLMTLYTPMLWLMTTPLERPMERYVNWWETILPASDRH